MLDSVSLEAVSDKPLMMDALGLQAASESVCIYETMNDEALGTAAALQSEGHATSVWCLNLIGLCAWVNQERAQSEHICFKSISDDPLLSNPEIGQLYIVLSPLCELQLLINFALFAIVLLHSRSRVLCVACMLSKLTFRNSVWNDFYIFGRNYILWSALCLFSELRIHILLKI